MSYHDWPFQPFRQHSVENVERWWRHCHLSGVGEQLLLDSPHWVVIEGGPGSGKSVALTALRNRPDGASFVVPYPPSRWPGSPQALQQNESSHLAQMMACASLTLRDYLQANIEQAWLLSDLQREFLRWLLQRYFGARTYHMLIHRLPDELAAAFRDVPYVELFPSLENPLDVQGQIDELVCLAQTLGFRRVLFAVDINAVEMSPELVTGLSALFGWLELMHHPGFVLAAAVPGVVWQESQIKPRVRHRLRRIAISWTTAQCRQIADNHIRLATEQEDASLTAYAEEALLREMASLIEAEYGAAVPAGWVALAETVLYLACRSNLPAPLKLSDWAQLCRAFYARHFPLRLDEQKHGVWRGPRFIYLDPQPLRLLTLFFQRRGEPASWADEDVRSVAGSANNVHSIASRIRKAIEPETVSEPVYLINKRGAGGYWLENYAASS
jgi:hypothetical protein